MRRMKDFVPKVVAGSVLSLAIFASFAHPANAIDAKKTLRDMLPTKTSVSAPAGASGLCTRYDWACARTGKTRPIDLAAMAVAQKINTVANRKVRPVSDQAQWSIAERWSLPTARGGDCEDYAMLKKMMLIQAGFSPDQLLIATVLDRQRRSHAVLILRTGTQDLVLDNMTGRIKHWRDTGYTFLRLQDPRRPDRWVGVFAGGVLAKIS
ncbi:hypothetical protein HYN69_17220 [Gemmobacter aquarius]|uniref:Transglutaminase-like cysteine proteinase BTLCP n=1 Tax=Paragemmobacter aquarius TaxID=2169400 RepID=A0A2S0UQG8_9RHOB|nr:transglutaminase-like cysteine peptidase [Gemmobacter aquarius]AWB50010.1 hypothetical protein HYN69_17220 [Gemmobacter aquarius]